MAQLVARGGVCGGGPGASVVGQVHRAARAPAELSQGAAGVVRFDGVVVDPGPLQRMEDTGCMGRTTTTRMLLYDSRGIHHM